MNGQQSADAFRCFFAEGEIGGLHACGATLRYIVPLPNIPQDAAPPLLTRTPPVGDLLVAKPSLKLPRSYQWNIALE
jgi:hypothetical protein